MENKIDQYTLCYLPFDNSAIEDLCGNTWEIIGTKSPYIVNSDNSVDLKSLSKFKTQLKTISETRSGSIVNTGALKLSGLQISPQNLTISLWVYLIYHFGNSLSESFSQCLFNLKGQKYLSSGLNSFNNNIKLSFEAKSGVKGSEKYSVSLNFLNRIIKIFKTSVTFQRFFNITLCVYTPDPDNPFIRNYYVFLNGKQIYGISETRNYDLFIEDDIFDLTIGANTQSGCFFGKGYLKNFQLDKTARYIGEVFDINQLFSINQLKDSEIPDNSSQNNLENVQSSKYYLPFEMIAITDELPALSGGNTIILYPVADMELLEYWCSGSYVGRGGVKYNLSCTTGKVEIVNNVGNCLYDALKSDNQDNSTLDFIYSEGSQPQFGTLEFWIYIDFNEENTVFKLTGNTIGETNYESITINLGNSSYKIIPIFEGENIDSYIKTESISSINRKWTHIAISFTGSYLEIFIDGKKKFQIEIMCFSSILNIISFYLWNKNNSINYITNIRFCDFIRYSEDFEITLPTSAYNINENENIKPIDQEKNIPDEEEDNQEEEEKEKDGDE